LQEVEVAFRYDVFVSYSRNDRDWADQVYRSFDAGQSIFFDYESLRAGDDWEAKIESALEDSQSLVLLWSDQAKNSDWVTRELWSFVNTAKPKQNPNRRIILVNLQGMNDATKGYQQISRPELQRAYDQRTGAKDADWRQARFEIRDGLTLKKPVSVPVVTLTLMLAEFNNLPPGQRARIQQDLDLSDPVLKDRYGATRQEWKPYVGAQPISKILDGIRDSVNLALTAHRIAWREPPDCFWADIEDARNFVKSDFHTADLSLLIVDPVAVYNIDAFQRLLLFEDSLTSDRRVIVTLPPFEAPQHLRQLRAMLANRASPYFDDYLQPAVPPRRRLSAQCAWNITDGEDVKRHILAAAAYLGATIMPGKTPVFLKQGE
jgi:hypothetical protein